MQALNEPALPLPLPLALLPELDGLLPQALRTSVAAATPASTAPDRFLCTDVLPLVVGPGGRAGSGGVPDGPDPDPSRGCAAVVDQYAGGARRRRPLPRVRPHRAVPAITSRSAGGALLIAHVRGWCPFVHSCRGRYQRSRGWREPACPRDRR